ncbi:ubiquitin hydrolase, putative, partial [Leishmania donovani]
MPCYCIEEV